MRRFLRNSNVLEGPLLSQIIFYTIPIMLSGVLQLLFNAADLVIVGRFCGSISVAAVGATGSLTNLIVTLFMGFSTGAGVAVSHAYGAGNRDDVHKVVHTTVPLAIIFGAVLTVVGIIFSDDFLHLMDTPENILPLASLYMKIYFGGIIFNLLYNFCAVILRSVGDTKSPLISLFIAGFVNVILNIIFVTAFHMNVAGVALATVISQAVSALLVIYSLMCRPDSARLFLKELKIYKEFFFKILRFGLPAGIQGSVFALSNVIIQSSINSFGDIAVSGNAAGGNIEGFVYICMNAFYHTILTFTGQNYGAKQFKRIAKSVWTSMGLVTIVGVVIGGLTYLFAEPLLSIYITDSAEAIAFGVKRLLYIAVPYFMCGLMEVSTGALRGLGVSIASMIISILGVCGVRIVWIFTVFAKFHTLECLYMSYYVSWIFTLLTQFIVFFVIFKKKKGEINV